MFHLSEDTAFQVETELWAQGSGARVFWQTSVHTRPPRLGLVVLAGSRIVLPEMQVGQGDTGLVTIGAALPGISADGLDASVRFRSVGREHVLAETHIAGVEPEQPWLTMELPVDEVRGQRGQIVVECSPGPAGDPSADWLALYECVVSAPDERGLARARSFQCWRLNNELEHFSARQVSDEHDVEGRDGYSAFLHAHDLLRARLSRPNPDFGARLAEKSRAASSVRVLSLCSGSADMERRLLQQAAGSRIELTLLDVNPDLVTAAAKRLAGLCEVRTLTADLNRIDRGAVRRC